MKDAPLVLARKLIEIFYIFKIANIQIFAFLKLSIIIKWSQQRWGQLEF